ncbi:MAG: N-acetylmuramoyl-L-alanine amidase [bacterium]
MEENEKPKTELPEEAKKKMSPEHSSPTENKDEGSFSSPAEEPKKEEEELLNVPPQPRPRPEQRLNIKPETEPQSEPEPEIKPEIKSEPQNQPQEPVIPKPERPQPPEMPVQEKKELLSRIEVRTMAKDVSKLREGEAEKEREKLANLKTEQNVPKPTIISQPPPIHEIKKEGQEETGKLIPKPLKKPSSFQKIAIRVISVLFLILAIFFFYWFLNIKLNQKPETTPAEQTEMEETTETEETQETTEPIEESTEEVTEETIEPKAISKPEILENMVTWGFYIPQTPRIIDTIILHSAYNALGGDIYSIEKIIEEFKLYKVTPHYLIDKNGTIYQLAPDNAIAYHAGRGEMPDGSRKNIINNFSLGIEMVYFDTETPNEIQLEKLVDLVSYLRKEYNVPTENILEHKDVSLSGKNDPWNFEREDFISLLK